MSDEELEVFDAVSDDKGGAEERDMGDVASEADWDDHEDWDVF